MTLLAAGIGIILAIGGMYEWLIPFLVLLGSIIPPLGGVIMADYGYRNRGEYPALVGSHIPAFNVTGLASYAVGAGLAYASPWIAPLVGIGASAICYIVLTEVTRARAPVAEPRA
jgi:cytosine permease